jgi:hypothetical protein
MLLYRKGNYDFEIYSEKREILNLKCLYFAYFIMKMRAETEKA